MVATGAYMVSSEWAWNDGWIDVAIGGVVLLFISGEYLSSRGRALASALGGDPRQPVSAPVTQMLRDPSTRSISYATTSLSIGIVFVMVNKPSVLGAIAALVVTGAIGIGLAAVRGHVDSCRIPAAPRNDSADDSADAALVRAQS
jgi:hypothetical protein